MPNFRGRLSAVVACCAALAAWAAAARGDMPLDDFPRERPSREWVSEEAAFDERGQYFDDEEQPRRARADEIYESRSRSRRRGSDLEFRAPYDDYDPRLNGIQPDDRLALHQPYVLPPPAAGVEYPSAGYELPYPAAAPPPLYRSPFLGPSGGQWSTPRCGELAYDLPWTWQLLPQGLIWHSYLAGVREARVASVFNYQQGTGWLWDPTIGARVGLLRYGTPNAFRPDGWELDVEGAAFPELLVGQNWDLHSADFRVGVPLTYGAGPLQFKLAWYHLSSHLGDEYIVSHPGVQRINYSRNAIVFGTSYFPTDNLRLYGEVDWAYYTDGGTKPWMFQFGTEYSPIFHPGFIGTPFAAINGILRQEVNYGGSLTVQVGWQWFNATSGTRLRFGFQYFNGKNEQYQFFNQFVSQFGIGIWYDF